MPKVLHSKVSSLPAISGPVDFLCSIQSCTPLAAMYGANAAYGHLSKTAFGAAQVMRRSF
jgi:hypothetical protein